MAGWRQRPGEEHAGVITTENWITEITTIIFNWSRWKFDRFLPHWLAPSPPTAFFWMFRTRSTSLLRTNEIIIKSFVPSIEEGWGTSLFIIWNREKNYPTLSCSFSLTSSALWMTWKTLCCSSWVSGSMVEVLPAGRPVDCCCWVDRQLVAVVGLLSIRFDLADDHPKCNL